MSRGERNKRNAAHLAEMADELRAAGRIDLVGLVMRATRPDGTTGELRPLVAVDRRRVMLRLAGIARGTRGEARADWLLFAAIVACTLLAVLAPIFLAAR